MLKIHGQEDENANISKDKNFSCPTCDAQFTEKQNLKRHLINKHNINQTQIEKQQKLNEQQIKKDEMKRKKEESVKEKAKNKKTVNIVPFDLTIHENNGTFYFTICDRPFVTAEGRNRQIDTSHNPTKQKDPMNVKNAPNVLDLR